MTTIFFDTTPSPVGKLLLAANENGLTHLLFTPLVHNPRLTEAWVAVTDTSHALNLASTVTSHANGALPACAHLQRVREELQEYFAGARQTFTVPLAAAGTPFQREVWQALSHIPYGSTWSYRDVAHHIGRPKAMRAVGLANGRNPISIVVPCHRVIGANGTLTGYGGGIERKQQLLSLEYEAALSSQLSD